MTLYVESDTPGVYNLLDVFINETVALNTRTIYQQDLTAVYKGFTNSFSVDATPNNIITLGYFGETELSTAPKTARRAKMYLGEDLFKLGMIKIENTSWKNNQPSLFQLEFSDGSENLTQLMGEDTLTMLADGDTFGNISFGNEDIYNALQSIQSSSEGMRWFVPQISNNRIFTIDASHAYTDNLAYSGQSIGSEDVLLNDEVRPAMFVTDILKKIENKYGFAMGIPYYDTAKKINQLTDLAVHGLGNAILNKPRKANITKTTWDSDTFREERFDIIIRNDLNGFELHYLGTGTTSSQSTFGMDINLPGVSSLFLNSIEIWQMDSLGNPTEKLSYAIVSGSELKSTHLKVNISTDIFVPDGQTSPSTLVHPLICVMISADKFLSTYQMNVFFDWGNLAWKKNINANNQINIGSTTNLFNFLPKIKVVDFVKSIYTMFGMKSFSNKDGSLFTLNDFNYVPKKVNGVSVFVAPKVVNEEISQYADNSLVTKKPNAFYDGYNLKHATSKYVLNQNYLASTGLEYGQLKYTLAGKPKSEFLIDTIFTAPVLVNIKGGTAPVNTFHPFSGEPHLNDTATRYIYDVNNDELPIFYYNGTVNMVFAPFSTGYAYHRYKTSSVIEIKKYHAITRRSNKVSTGTNFITCLFGTVAGDLPAQNTLYIQGYKDYIEGTLSGKRLIHEINLTLPNQIMIDGFNNSQDVVIGETLFQVLESNITLTDGKAKLTLLNR